MSYSSSTRQRIAEPNARNRIAITLRQLPRSACCSAFFAARSSTLASFEACTLERKLVGSRSIELRAAGLRRVERLVLWLCHGSHRCTSDDELLRARVAPGIVSIRLEEIAELIEDLQQPLGQQLEVDWWNSHEASSSKEIRCVELSVYITPGKQACATAKLERCSSLCGAQASEAGCAAAKA